MANKKRLKQRRRSLKGWSVWANSCQLGSELGLIGEIEQAKLPSLLEPVLLGGYDEEPFVAVAELLCQRLDAEPGPGVA